MRQSAAKFQNMQANIEALKKVQRLVERRKIDYPKWGKL